MDKVYDFFTSAWKKFLHLFYWPLLTLRVIFFPLSKLTFVVVILLVGYYAICINDQGQDLMAAFTAKSIFRPDNLYLRLFELFILFWAIATWNVSRILLAAANLTSIIKSEVSKSKLDELGVPQVFSNKEMMVVYVDTTYQKWLKVTNDWFPRLLAVIPYVIFFIGYQQQAKAFKAHYPWNLIVMGLVAVLHFLYMCLRRWISDKLFTKKPTADPGVEILEEEKNLLKAIKKSRVVWNTVLTILMVLIMFIYSRWAANDFPKPDGKPGLIVITGLTFYTLIGLLINYTVNRVRVPLFLIAVLIATLVFFNWNNNHSIQTLTSDADRKILEGRNKMNDFEYADYWLAKKFPDTSFNGKDTVFIVAAEGGGIRNCYWTYCVLSELQKRKPDFFDKTFVVTGVSGGSIGLGFYYNFNYFFDNHRNSIRDSAEFYRRLDTIASSDYLSRVTYGFLFPDLVQRFLPFPIESWDRSKMLANSFDDGFSKRIAVEEKLLSKNYLSVWADTSVAYKYPVVLYNTIINEDGLKAVFSPYRLSDTYYPGVMDILLEINQSVPIKEAMTSSARFPLLTAPGLLNRYDTGKGKNPKPIGHISDGGGFENTAIQTAQQTAGLLRNRIKTKGYKGIDVKVIYIGTGKSSIEISDAVPASNKKYKEAIVKAYEIAWLYGGVNTIFGWMRSAHNQSIRINPDYRLLQFGLAIREDSSKHQLPLGWFLSDTSRKLIRDQLYDSIKNRQVYNNLKAFGNTGQHSGN